jgi:hypothetical protein
LTNGGTYNNTHKTHITTRESSIIINTDLRVFARQEDVEDEAAGAVRCVGRTNDHRLDERTDSDVSMIIDTQQANGSIIDEKIESSNTFHDIDAIGVATHKHRRLQRYRQILSQLRQTIRQENKRIISVITQEQQRATAATCSSSVMMRVERRVPAEVDVADNASIYPQHVTPKRITFISIAIDSA